MRRASFQSIPFAFLLELENTLVTQTLNPVPDGRHSFFGLHFQRMALLHEKLAHRQVASFATLVNPVQYLLVNIIRLRCIRRRKVALAIFSSGLANTVFVYPTLAVEINVLLLCAVPARHRGPF